MNPIEHLLISWAVAEATPLERRDRALAVDLGRAVGAQCLAELRHLKGESPVEIVSARANEALVRTLRTRFG